MLDLARMFGSFSGLQSQPMQYVQAPQQQQLPNPITGRQRRMQRLSDRLATRPFGAKRGQNGQQVTQDLAPMEDPNQQMSMMDDPFVSEGWNGPTSTYNPMNLGAMLGRRNFF